MAEQARAAEQQPANMAELMADLMADLMAEARGTTCLKPYEISAELRPKIDALALWDNVAELRDHGYTVVHDVAPPEMFDELREAIHMLAQESEGDLKGLAASMLLGRHPVVDAVATLPKILAVAEASVGQGMRASQFVASIKREGGAGLDVHADQNWLPAPFPAHNCVITFCMPCEGMTDAGGATRIVPGSQALRRPPTPEELEHAKTIPVEVEKGAVAVWDGSVWHGAGPRTIPGTRTVLHATYQRLYTQPIDDYTYLLQDETYVKNASKELLGLLGAGLFYGTATATSGGVDMVKFLKSAILAKK